MGLFRVFFIKTAAKHKLDKVKRNMGFVFFVCLWERHGTIVHEAVVIILCGVVVTFRVTAWCESRLCEHVRCIGEWGTAAPLRNGRTAVKPFICHVMIAVTFTEDYFTQCCVLTCRDSAVSVLVLLLLWKIFEQSRLQCFAYTVSEAFMSVKTLCIDLRF